MYYKAHENQQFVGRSYELNQIRSISLEASANILVVYGRRRVGKTVLIEQALFDRNIWKFEGLENQAAAAQRQRALWQLAQYLVKPHIAKIQTDTWLEFFKIVYDHLPNENIILYIEEAQWLANYKDEFISDLKYAWDNFFRHKHDLLLVLCGSSPSFMINKVLHSKALYNRSMHSLPLKPFALVETQGFLAGKSRHEVMDAYLLVGGIPEYLKYLKTHSSVLTSLCENTFVPGGFFLDECEKIFISSMAEKKHYRQIIEFLAKRKFASRKELLTHLKIQSSGTLSDVLTDLAQCGFIEKYTPYSSHTNSLISRYCIRDNYLQFYYKFINPNVMQIQHGDFVADPTSAINMSRLQIWLAFAFERFCRAQHRLIAKYLGFSAVNYQCGAYFKRGIDTSNPGFQIDLLFDRDDKVITVCEIRYTKAPVSKKVIKEMQDKLELLDTKKSIHKVLISSAGADEALLREHYFDATLDLACFFND